MWLNKPSFTSFGNNNFLPLWLSLLHDWFYPFVWAYKIINKIIFWFFGKSAHTKKSKGYIKGGKYLIFKGKVDKGDMIFYT